MFNLVLIWLGINSRAAPLAVCKFLFGTFYLGIHAETPRPKAILAWGHGAVWWTATIPAQKKIHNFAGVLRRAQSGTPAKRAWRVSAFRALHNFAGVSAGHRVPRAVLRPAGLTPHALICDCRSGQLARALAGVHDRSGWLVCGSHRPGISRVIRGQNQVTRRGELLMGKRHGVQFGLGCL